jgi:hypothetical protein
VRRGKRFRLMHVDTARFLHSHSMRCVAVSPDRSIYSSTCEQRRRSLSLYVVHRGVVSSPGDYEGDALDILVDDVDDDDDDDDDSNNA